MQSDRINLRKACIAKMTESDETTIFICPFCSKAVKVRPANLGKRAACPGCAAPVILVSNQNRSAAADLATTWNYRRARLLVGTQDVGPLDGKQFISAVESGDVTATTQVMSPEQTGGKWIDCQRINLDVLRQRVAQLHAEGTRYEQQLAKKNEVQAENRRRLRMMVQRAIEDGHVSSGESQSLAKFAEAAKITAHELEELVRTEGFSLLGQLVAEALADGVLSPGEEEQISRLALGLGLQPEFSHDDCQRIALCRFAHEIDAGLVKPLPPESVSFKTDAKEVVYLSCEAQWCEVVSLKRPQGVPLGGDRYLKSSGIGVVYVTSKQLVRIGDFESSRISLSSVLRVTIYADGILFNRSSGKSVFLVADTSSAAVGKLALIAQYLCSGDPVQARFGLPKFVPDLLVGTSAPEVADRFDAAGEASVPHHEQPRYTFRVVGHHVGGRSALIARLQPRDSIFLQREPTNPHDANAIAVLNSTGEQLGYLKREVAEWFSPVMKRRDVQATVHTVSYGGGLIVGVYL